MKKIPTLDELRRDAAAPADETDAADAADPGVETDAPGAAGATDAAGAQPASPWEIPAVGLAEAMQEAMTPRDAEPAVGSDASARSASAAEAKPAAGAKKKRGSGTNRRQQRRFARERAVQALYQWDVASASSSQVRVDFLEHQDMSRVDVDYFEELFRGVSLDPDKVDTVLEPALDRTLDELDPVERAILRASVWELQNRLDTPARVVINEGVEIAKRFGADQGHKFVNAVLDRLGARLRATEMGRG